MIPAKDDSKAARQDRLQRLSSQELWATTPLKTRLKILRRTRHRLAAMTAEITAAISPTLQRTAADTLAAELLPLLDAMRFLEDEAPQILQTRKLDSTGRPTWLAGIESEVQRVPHGHILVIGPSNFPLFLPGVQVMQALAAGNSVTWKPGRGGRAVADRVAGALRDAGLPIRTLTVTEDTLEASYAALRAAPDKVVFTGSVDAGKDILTVLAESTTPTVMELSGADAVVVLPSADLALAAKALAFGLRFNGSAVCMAPRRLLLLGDTLTALRPLLLRELAAVPPVHLPEATAAKLKNLVDEAVHLGAILHGELSPALQKPLLLDGTRPAMEITSADIFAPVLSIMTVSTIGKFADVYAECPYALTVAVFGKESEALKVASTLRAGTTLINDVIVPTVDPRVPFGGRDASGFGSTRGAEGLLEMTAVRTVLVRSNKSTRHYEPTTETHAAMFEGMIQSAHAKGFAARFAGLRKMIGNARKLK